MTSAERNFVKKQEIKQNMYLFFNYGTSRRFLLWILLSWRNSNGKWKQCRLFACLTAPVSRELNGSSLYFARFAYVKPYNKQLNNLDSQALL